MELCRKTILLLMFSSFMSVGWGQDCDENMFWTDCGLPFECNPTCSNPNPPPDCFTLCEIGCFCNEGYIFSDDSFNECTLIENCPEPSLCDEEIEVELWGECYNIEETLELDLSNSGLTGEIPPEIGNLTNLTDLYLWSNQLTGEIPPEIGNLTNLTSLYLSFNQLTGEIPPEIVNLTNLFWLFLDNNQLTGEIPEIICNINLNFSSLYFFSIFNNQLCPPYPDCGEGPITSEEEQDTSECEEPFLCDEGYTEIDGECYFQSDLDVLQDFIDLNENLSEVEPLEIGFQEWTDGRIEYLFLSYNQLTTLPEGIGDLSSLVRLYLQENQLTTIPESIGNLSSLEYLYLNDNQLTTLPESIGNLTSLVRLYLYVNQLTTLPESIGNLSSLDWLYSDNNQLTTIPESIGNLNSLIGLGLSSNQLTTLPESICNLNIDWDNSFLCGNNYICDDIPECIIDSNGLNYILDDYLGYYVYQPQNCDECILGDVNNDSMLNILDIVSIITLILDGEYDECGDVNSDGDLNILDVVIFVNIILSIP